MLRSKYWVVLLALLPTSAFAQFAANMQWGTGAWGGSQGCGYQQQTGQGAVSEDDPLQEMLAEIQEIKSQIKAKKAEVKKLDRLSERSHDRLSESLSPDVSNFVFAHIENSNRCTEYQGLSTPPVGGQESFDGGSQGDQPIAAAQDNMLEVQGMSSAEWFKHCDRTKAGSVRESICNISAPPGEARRADPRACKKDLVEYRKNYTESKKLATEIERMENSLEDRKQDLADLKKELREEARDATTQGDYCAECNRRGNGYTYEKPQTNWGGVLANVGTGLLASYMGYKSNKMISENNADLGFPTYNSNYSALGYGMPYFQAGLYGALSGGQGQGGFGCGGGMNTAGGAFGYPSSMMGGSMGGGMFMGNPYMMGMNGMGGMMGMNGMMGMGMMSGSGNMMGNMMGSGMMMSDPSSLALQSQLMQTQYQQQMSKYSAMSSLQTELYSLMARIQQVQYGSGSSSYLGTGIGSSYTNGVLPAPSGSTYNGYSIYNGSGILPAPSTTSSSGILTSPTTYYGR